MSDHPSVYKSDSKMLAVDTPSGPSSGQPQLQSIRRIDSGSALRYNKGDEQVGSECVRGGEGEERTGVVFEGGPGRGRERVRVTVCGERKGTNLY